MVKKIITIVLIVAAVVGAIAGIDAISKIKTKSVSSMSFSVGGINPETGKYIDQENTICTKNPIECKGLTIVPRVNESSTYQIFWYNMDDIYFGCEDVTNGSFDSKNVPAQAKYCRIVVYPSGKDKNGDPIKDFKINFWEPARYADAYKIKVNMKQDNALVDYYALATEDPEKISTPDTPITNITDDYLFIRQGWLYINEGNTLSTCLRRNCNPGYSIVKLDCSSTKSYYMELNPKSEGNYYVTFFEENGNVIVYHKYNISESLNIVVNVPENADYVCFSVAANGSNKTLECPIVINEYLPRNEITEALYN